MWHTRHQLFMRHHVISRYFCQMNYKTFFSKSTQFFLQRIFARLLSPQSGVAMGKTRRKRGHYCQKELFDYWKEKTGQWNKPTFISSLQKKAIQEVKMLLSSLKKKKPIQTSISVIWTKLLTPYCKRARTTINFREEIRHVFNST